MALQFDNRVSWMDIVAIAGGIATAGAVFFGMGGKIDANKTEIEYIKINVKRIEADADRRSQKILVQLKEQRDELKAYREESKEDNRQVVQKLDRLIERELNNH